jgi:hypothetical protein
MLQSVGEPIEWEELEDGIRISFRRMGPLGVKFGQELARATVASTVPGSFARRTSLRPGMVLVSIETPARRVDSSCLDAKRTLRELRAASHSRPLNLVFQHAPGSEHGAGGVRRSSGSMVAGDEGSNQNPTEHADDLGPGEYSTYVPLDSRKPLEYVYALDCRR